jgi:hypothetical protein
MDENQPTVGDRGATPRPPSNLENNYQKKIIDFIFKLRYLELLGLIVASGLIIYYGRLNFRLSNSFLDYLFGFVFFPFGIIFFGAWFMFWLKIVFKLCGITLEEMKDYHMTLLSNYNKYRQSPKGQYEKQETRKAIIFLKYFLPLIFILVALIMGYIEGEKFKIDELYRILKEILKVS